MSNKILEALKSREWVDFLDIFSGQVFQMCPTCNQTKENGHKQDCEYLDRMKEAERLPKRLTVEAIAGILSSSRLYYVEDDFGENLDFSKSAESILPAINAAIYGGEEPDHE